MRREQRVFLALKMNSGLIFCRLPTRYAMDVNEERADDVIMHKRLLQLAHNPDTLSKLISITASTSSHQAKAKIIPVTQSKIRSPRCSKKRKKKDMFLYSRSSSRRLLESREQQQELWLFHPLLLLSTLSLSLSIFSDVD